MNNIGFDRLLEEQKTGIEQTDLEIKKLLSSKGEYESLLFKLEDLQKSFSKRACLPFSSKAFVMGILVHTNEVLAYLGGTAGYFAEMSSYEATQLIRRRISRIDVVLNALEQQKRLIQDRLQFTSDFNLTKRIISSKDECGPLADNEEVEIREDYDSDAERTWKFEHAKSRRKEREELERLPSPKLMDRKVSFSLPSECLDSSDEEKLGASASPSSTIYFRHSRNPGLPVRTNVSDLSTLTLTEAVSMQINLGKITSNELDAASSSGPIADHLPPITSVTVPAVAPTRMSRFKADRLQRHQQKT